MSGESCMACGAARSLSDKFCESCGAPALQVTRTEAADSLTVRRVTSTPISSPSAPVRPYAATPPVRSAPFAAAGDSGVRVSSPSSHGGLGSGAARRGSTAMVRVGGLIAAVTGLLLLQASVAIIAGPSSFAALSAPTDHRWPLLLPRVFDDSYGFALLLESVVMLVAGALCVAGVRLAALTAAILSGVLGTSYLSTRAPGGILIDGTWHHVLGGVEVAAAVLILLPIGWRSGRAKPRTALVSLLIGTCGWFVIRVPFCWAAHITNAEAKQNLIQLGLAALLAATAVPPVVAGLSARVVTQTGAFVYAAALALLGLTDSTWTWWSGVAPFVVVTVALWVLASQSGEAAAPVSGAEVPRVS